MNVNRESEIEPIVNWQLKYAISLLKYLAARFEKTYTGKTLATNKKLIEYLVSSNNGLDLEWEEKEGVFYFVLLQNWFQVLQKYQVDDFMNIQNTEIYEKILSGELFVIFSSDSNSNKVYLIERYICIRSVQESIFNILCKKLSNLK